MSTETPVHLLTPGHDLRQVTVACQARMPERGSWDVAAITCSDCLRTAPAAPVPGTGSSMTEKQWLAQVRTLAHTHGWMTYHTWNAQRSECGWVDLVLLRGPVLKLVELKRQTGRLTGPQRQWLDELAQVEVVQVHLWRPDDWDEVLEALT